MDHRNCPFCAEEIKSEAIKCKHCGSSLLPPIDRSSTVVNDGVVVATEYKSTNKGTLWLPIPSLVLGIMSVLALFDDSAWDMETIVGLFLFSGTGLVLGIISVSTQTKGRGMAISGIVLSSIGILAGLGLSTMM